MNTIEEYKKAITSAVTSAFRKLFNAFEKKSKVELGIETASFVKDVNGDIAKPIDTIAKAAENGIKNPFTSSDESLSEKLEAKDIKASGFIKGPGLAFFSSVLTIIGFVTSIFKTKEHAGKIAKKASKIEKGKLVIDNLDSKVSLAIEIEKFILKAVSTIGLGILSFVSIVKTAMAFGATIAAPIASFMATVAAPLGTLLAGFKVLYAAANSKSTSLRIASLKRAQKAVSKAIQSDAAGEGVENKLESLVDFIKGDSAAISAPNANLFLKAKHENGYKYGIDVSAQDLKDFFDLRNKYLGLEKTLKKEGLNLKKVKKLEGEKLIAYLKGKKTDLTIEDLLAFKNFKKDYKNQKTNIEGQIGKNTLSVITDSVDQKLEELRGERVDARADLLIAVFSLVVGIGFIATGYPIIAGLVVGLALISWDICNKILPIFWDGHWSNRGKQEVNPVALSEIDSYTPKSEPTYKNSFASIMEREIGSGKEPGVVFERVQGEEKSIEGESGVLTTNERKEAYEHALRKNPEDILTRRDLYNMNNRKPSSSLDGLDPEGEKYFQDVMSGDFSPTSS